MIARAAILAVLASACGDNGTGAPAPEVTAFSARANRAVDLLILVDNSASTLAYQVELGRAMPALVGVLGELDGGIPEVRVGVVTSDLGTSGGPDVGTGIGSCRGVGDDGVLQGGFVTDVTDVSALARLVEVGSTGCGFEQHLAGVARALANPANAGFRRAGANLAILIIGDEDDCSMVPGGALVGDDPSLGPLGSLRCFTQGVTCDDAGCRPNAASATVEDPATFVPIIDAAAGDPRRATVAVIAGDPTPVAIVPAANGQMLGHSCSWQTADGVAVADPAVRLASFAADFGARGQFASVCTPDLAPALTSVGAAIKRLVGDPCIAPASLDATCDVRDVLDSDPAHPIAIPSCDDASGGDCFRIVADPIACPRSIDHARVAITRSTMPADDAWTHVRCAAP